MVGEWWLSNLVDSCPLSAEVGVRELDEFKDGAQAISDSFDGSHSCDCPFPLHPRLATIPVRQSSTEAS